MNGGRGRPSTLASACLLLLLSLQGVVGIWLRGAKQPAAASAACGGAGGSGLLLCDDFEEGYTEGPLPAGAVWMPFVNRGDVSVNASRAHSGKYAVRLSTQAAAAGGKTAFMRLGGRPLPGLQLPTPNTTNATTVSPLSGVSVLPLPQGKNAFYGRFMFLLEDAPKGQLKWTFIQSGGLIKPRPHRDSHLYHAMLRYGGLVPVEGGSQLAAGYDTPDFYTGIAPGTDCVKQADGAVMPVGRWTCVEFWFDGSGEASDMRLWLDGDEVKSLKVEGVGQTCAHQDPSYPWVAPVFETLDIGWESVGPDSSERVLWVDDVMLAMEPIGCPTTHAKGPKTGGR